MFRGKFLREKFKLIVMQVPVFLIDTFTAEKDKGNPTAVCLLYSPMAPGNMQSIAKELAVPVTAFVELTDEPAAITPIRYFTGITEIPACGHATLAAAEVVLKLSAAEKATFKTIAGIAIEVKRVDGVIVLTYPRYHLKEITVPEGVLQSLSLPQYASAGFCAELETLFIELESAALLRSIQPDYKQMVQGSNDIKEVVITSASDDERYDFLLRSFCPWIGIDEDPVTGSVHSVLAGFWKQRLGKQQLKAYQASARGGELYVTGYDDKVELGGKTVIVSVREW